MIRMFIAALAAVSLLSGCATGVTYSTMASSIPPLKEGQGRIFFFRSSSIVGAAIQPEIRLNGSVIGKSQPGGFFYVDRPAGSYQAATSTETEKTLSFVLGAGEVKYVRTSPALGVLVGRIVLELETSEKARAELPDLSYTGTNVAAAPQHKEKSGQQVSTSGKTNMDDLKGLLPAK